MVGGGGDGQKDKNKKNLAIQYSVYFLMAGTPAHPHLWPLPAWRGVAVLARLIRTTWQGLEGSCPHVAGSRLSGEGLGSVTEGLGHLDVLQGDKMIV